MFSTKLLKDYLRQYYMGRMVLRSLRSMTDAFMAGLSLFISLPIVFPALIILYMCEPFYRIRLHHLGETNRIGWLAVGPDYILRKWDREGRPDRSLDLIVLCNPANDALYNMVRRKLTVLNSRAVNGILEMARPLTSRTRFVSYEAYQYHKPAHYKNEVAFFSFTAEEERYGQKLLRDMGIGEHDWFVTFHSRENVYFEQSGIKHWSIANHEYRNCSVENYLQAAKKVIARGGFAIRMGTPGAPPLQSPLPHGIIDYATRYHQPFGDAYLCAKSKFFLGNTSGLICVASIFGTRSGLANQVPFSSTPLLPGDLWIPKLVRERQSGRLLNFREVFALGLFSTSIRSDLISDLMTTRGLVFEENTAEDIAELCDDLLDQCDGKAPPEGARAMQEYFRDAYEQEILPDGPLPLIGPRFALRYAHLIRPAD